MAVTDEEGARPGGGPLHQQRGHGPWAALPGGPQWQEHGDSVEKRGVVLSSSGAYTVLVSVWEHFRWSTETVTGRFLRTATCHTSSLDPFIWSFSSVFVRRIFYFDAAEWITARYVEDIKNNVLYFLYENMLISAKKKKNFSNQWATTVGNSGMNKDREFVSRCFVFCKLNF